MKRHIARWLGALLLLCPVGTPAQLYTGTTGLLHTPSAEMNDAGTACIGGYFLNKAFTPAAFTYDGKYHTGDYFLSLTPFSWIELGYTCTLLKNIQDDGRVGWGQDRYFSVKVRPLREGKYWPAVAIGSNDPLGTGYKGMLDVSHNSKSEYFSNYYVAATKHFDFRAGQLGAHIAYRRFRQDYNGKWNGVTGASPSGRPLPATSGPWPNTPAMRSTSASTASFGDTSCCKAACKAANTSRAAYAISSASSEFRGRYPHKTGTTIQTSIINTLFKNSGKMKNFSYFGMQALLGAALLLGAASCHDDDPNYSNVTPPVVAEVHNISGSVVGMDGKGIAGATVTMSGTATGTQTTDANGYFVFDNVAVGTYNLQVTAPGKFGKATSVTVAEDGEGKNIV